MPAPRRWAIVVLPDANPLLPRSAFASVNTFSNPGPPPFSPRELKQGLVFFFILLLFAALIGYQVQVTRSAAQAAAITDANNLALVLESQIHAEFDAAARTLQVITDTIEPEALEPGQAERQADQINAWLKTHAAGHPIATALRIFDAQGHGLYCNLGQEIPFSIADRPFFQQLRDDPAADIVFSRVAIGRISGLPTMWVARAIRDPGGRFLGATVVAIELSVLHEQFSRIALGEKGVVVLRRLDDGATVVRFPGSIEVDNRPEPTIPTRLAVLNQGPAGHIEIISPVDGSQRLYGYRQISDFPFLVAVGIASEDYLLDWRQDTRRLLLVALLFVGVLATVFVLLILAQRRRDRTEQALRGSEARLRKLIHDNNSVILELDPPTGAIRDANAAACRFYGWSRAAFLEQRFQDICQSPADGVLEDLQRAVGGSRDYLVYDQVLANGERRCVEVYCTPLHLPEGPLLVSIVHDISERRRLEEELHHQNLLLNTILGNLDAHVFMKDRAGRFLYVNQAVADFLGLPISALVGSLQTEVLPPEAVAHLQELDEAVFTSGQAQSREEQLVDQKGQTRYFWTVKVPLRESGQPDRLIGLATDITELHNLREELERRATTDDLTGLANRGHFYATAATHLAQAQRYGEPLSLLILDIDHFKDVNDTHGHQAGDAILRGVAEHCREAIRTSDLIGRMGGEEFAILLPETGQESACHLAERLRQGLQARRWTGNVNDLAIAHGSDLARGPTRELAVTVSIGVATLTPAIPTLDVLYAQADQALYAAKAGGRNRVSGVCPSPHPINESQ